MPTDSERALAAEQTAEAARRQAHLSEAQRQSGVAWSGFAPGPFRPRSGAALVLAACRRVEALACWRASPSGRLLAAMAEAERAVQAIRACVARGLEGEPGRCAQALADLQGAVDEGVAAALTAKACATNIASRPPSIGSSTSSASSGCP